MAATWRSKFAGDSYDLVPRNWVELILMLEGGMLLGPIFPVWAGPDLDGAPLQAQAA